MIKAQFSLAGYMQNPKRVQKLGEIHIFGFEFYSLYAYPRIQIKEAPPGIEMPDKLKLQCVRFEKKHSFTWRFSMHDTDKRSS